MVALTFFLEPMERGVLGRLLELLLLLLYSEDGCSMSSLPATALEVQLLVDASLM